VAKQKLDLQESFSFMHEPLATDKIRPPFDPKSVFRMAAQGIYLGTSSWKYRGWEGMLYSKFTSEALFQRASLKQYCNSLPTVGVDFTYYTWPLAEMVSYLLESTPENFRLCPKVTKRITLYRFPDLPVYGKWVGKLNPDFLQRTLFEENFLLPLKALKSRLGVILFDIPQLPFEKVPDLIRFFRALPPDLSFAVEFREPMENEESIRRALIRGGVNIAFTVSFGLISLERQQEIWREEGGEANKDPIVVLGLLNPSLASEEANLRYQPFNCLKEPLGKVRGQIIEFKNCAMNQERKAYILIHNKLEGCAPITLGALVDSF